MVLLRKPCIQSKLEIEVREREKLYGLISKVFMKLLVKHFPKHDKYYTIFDKNTIKVNYSCILTMVSTVTKHDDRLLKENNHVQSRPCNIGIK